MIKRQGTGAEILITYVCDFCVKEMPGAAIQVYYPYGHCNDSIDSPSHFCSDKCLIEFQQKLVKKFRNWKSTPLAQEEKVRSSADFRKATQRKVEDTPKKARRATYRTSKKNKRPNQNDQATT